MSSFPAQLFRIRTASEMLIDERLARLRVRSEACAQVLLMQESDFDEVLFESFFERARPPRHSVLVAFAFADDDLIA